MSRRIPGLSSRTLDNGLDAIVIENHNVPLVTLEIAVKGGAYVEPPEFAGLSHLYEHMFFKGNRVLPNQQRYLDRLRELGATFNGTTGTERVNYYITLPSENLRDGVVFLRDALLYPLFKQDELERERVVVLGEFDRSEANPSWHLFHQMDRKIWHRYLSRKVPIGDRTIIATATREKMLTLKQRYYVPNNAALLFAGDVVPEEAFALAGELFGPDAWPRAEDPHALWPEPEHPPLERDELFVVLQPVKTATLLISRHGPGMLRDPGASFAADALSFILNQPTSRFHKRLIDSGLFDGLHLSYYSQVHTGPLNVYGITSAERLDKAHAALLVELEGLLEPDSFSDEELDFAKKQLEYSEVYSREKTTEFVHSVSFWWATAGLDYFEDYLDNLRAVTRADIHAFVRHYLHGAHAATGLLLSEEDLGKVELAASAEVLRPERGSSATAIRTQPRTEPVETFEIDGVRVLLRHTPYSEVVTAMGFLRGGLAYAGPERAGLELLMLEVAAKQTERFPKDVMARELTRLGAALSSVAQPDDTIFTLHTLHQNLAESFALFLDALVHPAFTEEEVALARERRLTVLSLEAQDPDSSLSRHALENFYAGHPYAVHPLGTRERVAAVRAQDLHELHAQTLSRSRLFLSVAGNLGRDELVALVAPALAELPRGAYHPEPLPPVPAAGRRSLHLEERDLPTVYLEGLFAAPNALDPDYPALYVGMALLHEALFDEIRSKRNLSYAPSARLRRRNANVGELYVTSVEPNACVRVMLDEIRRLSRTAVAESKLRNTVNERRTRLLSSLQTSAELAAWLGDFELHGGGWQRLEAFLDALAQLTPEQVRSAMERHVHDLSFAALGKLESLDTELLTSF